MFSHKDTKVTKNFVFLVSLWEITIVYFTKA